MKKIVIAGSAKLQKQINDWIVRFKNNNYEVLDYPKPINKNDFMQLYPKIHKSFFENIINTDILFIMNEDKNNIYGYIGSETFAELAFGLAQKLVYNKKIELVLLKMPSKNVKCYDEIKLWINLGWINLYEGDKK
ncbi:MAG: hypothetical protein IJO33_05340 [Bacilli bacterium]|nr:hypothetical protein [Bacilli bacterium]